MLNPDSQTFDILDRCYFWMTRSVSWAHQTIVSALIVIALSLLIAWPDIHHLTDFHTEWAEDAIAWKLHHPLDAIPVDRFPSRGPEFTGNRDHVLKQTYRITLPLISYCLGLDLRATEILSMLSSIAFSVVMLMYFRRLFPQDPVLTLLLGVAVGCSLLAQWGTCVYTFFDGVGYLLLACAAYTSSPLLVAAFLAAGGFSDERVILAAPLVYLLQDRSLLKNPDLTRLLRPNRQQSGTIAGVLLFVIGRILFGLHIGRLFDRSEVGLASLHRNLILLPVAWGFVYKGAILVMAFGFICLARICSGRIAGLLLLCVIPGIAASLLVWDQCRSLGFCFPMLLFCVEALAEGASLQTIRRIAICGALISACLPTYYLWKGSVRYLVPMLQLLPHHALSAIVR